MKPKQIAFISKDFKSELLEEINFQHLKILHQTKEVLWLDQDPTELAWAQGLWRDVQSLEIASITDAQKKLKEISPTWRYYGELFNRRGELIAEKLDRVVEIEKYHFTAGVVKKMPPAFTLAEPNLILYSKQVTRPSLTGQMIFKENKTVPPSRAYLKLWEHAPFLATGQRKQTK